MAHERHRQLSPSVLQEYLEALAASGGPSGQHRQRVLLSYAELQYRLCGGSRCAVCRKAVRHVLPVRVERNDGSVAEFPCLCVRCMEAERAQARSLILRVGGQLLEYEPPKTAAPRVKSAGANAD